MVDHSFLPSPILGNISGIHHPGTTSLVQSHSLLAYTHTGWLTCETGFLPHTLNKNKFSTNLCRPCKLISPWINERTTIYYRNTHAHTHDVCINFVLKTDKVCIILSLGMLFTLTACSCRDLRWQKCVLCRGHWRHRAERSPGWRWYWRKVEWKDRQQDTNE